jgi:SIR2-like domain
VVLSQVPKLACLVGNGLSIAYNRDLSVEELTRALVGNFQHLAGTNAGNELARFATSLTGQRSDDFERLLGPLDNASQALAYLEGLASTAGPQARQALTTTIRFLRDFHRLGVATVLDLVGRRSSGSAGDFEVVERFYSAVVALDFDKPISVGTLNYDGLAHAGSLDTATIADLATGYDSAPVLIDGSRTITGQLLRDEDNLLQDRAIQLLHLHGFLGWLRDPVTREVRKFDLKKLRDARFWQSLQAGRARLEPVVVLTNRKEDAIARRPFSLAYEIFRRRLVGASHWLIVGYGFGDEPLNAQLRSAVASRSALNMGLPKVLVVSHARDSKALARDAAAELELPPSQVVADGDGIPSAIGANAWQSWSP